MTTTDGPDLGDAPELTDPAALEAALEALLLVVDAPTEDDALAGALDQPVARVRATLTAMAQRYAADGRGIDLRRVGDGWRDVSFRTRQRVEVGGADLFTPSRAELRASLLTFGRPKDLERADLLAA